MNIKKYIKIALLALPVMGMGGSLASCSDMLDTDSDLVQFAEDNTLSTSQDTVHSVMGIIHKMQIIADRNILIGELRSDHVAVNERATVAVKDLANFNLNNKNEYNSIADYYAVINNCNYFLANADTTLSHLGSKVFEKEYAAVKAFRAWTYLQLAKIYGEVPLVLKPVLTETDAQTEMNKPYSDMTAICNYFINDLKGDVDVQAPDYGVINETWESSRFFIPVRVLLGEMSLWTNQYEQAAKYFYDFLTFANRPRIIGPYHCEWTMDNGDFSNTRPSTISSTVDYITCIPMEESELDGVISNLEDVYTSTQYNDYYAQVVPSAAVRAQARARDFVGVYESTGGKRDTIRVPKTGLRESYYAGDLRLAACYSLSHANWPSTYDYSKEISDIRKLVQTEEERPIYRLAYVYLMFAEALNRAGYPETAMTILKHGLTKQNIEKHISVKEQERAAAYMKWSDVFFDASTTIGIHSRGCGDATVDTLYVLPRPETELASYEDSVQYQIPLLEDMIIDEMAMEMMFEGTRYYDLMRVAMRRNDPAYLARPISRRNCSNDTDAADSRIYSILMDKKNWFLPIK